MNDKIRIGVIGCSSIAERSVIPAILEAENAELEFVGSRSNEKAKKIADKFGCKKFGNYSELLDDENIDLVYISLPIGLHEEWCIKAANAKKHILCEKSFSTSFKSTKKILDLCRTNDVRAMEGLMIRFHPRTQKIHEMIKNKTIGEVFLYSGNYGFPPVTFDNIRYNKTLGGGVLNETGCYPILMSRIIFDEEPIGVFSNIYFDKKLQVDIKGHAFLKFRNSKIGQISFSFDSFYQANSKIWGKKGMIETSRAFAIPPTLNSTIILENEEKRKEVTVQPANHFKLMIEKFSKEILSQNNNKIKFEDELLKQSRVLEAIRISNNENRFVFISEVK
jgi:dTDP-3,4-didehydro-2,6-dideoxy-alpha-D-glucose 3-reductase